MTAGNVSYLTLEAAERMEILAHGPKANARTGLVTVNVNELRAMNIPKREMVLSPILPTKGLAMMYAQRGIGKTHVGLGIAQAVATGTAFLKWKSLEPRKVLYVDGEMPANALQERIDAMFVGNPAEMPHSDYFRFLPMDLQEMGVGLNLAVPEDQQLVEDELKGSELLILDNLSTLVSAGRENDAESWDAMQAWLLKLRRQGVSVFLVHHAGRGENARGTSKREDVLDTVIHLKRPENYNPTEGARFEVHITKGRGISGQDAAPFEARLEMQNGQSVWTTRDVADAELEQVVAMSESGLSIRDIEKETGISKTKVARLLAKAKEQGLILV